MPSLFGLTAAFGAPLPEPLSALLRFQAADAEPYHEGFELAEVDVRTLVPDPPPRDGRRLFPFGVNGLGGAFALWATAEQPLDEAPVVYIDPEGQDDMVVARNLREFLSWLALDQEDPANLVDPADHEEKLLERGWTHAPRWPALVTWLREQFELRPPKDPLRAMEKAEEACPGFRSWMGHKDEEPVPPPPRPPPTLAEAVALGDVVAVQKHIERGLDPTNGQTRDAIERAIRTGRDDVLAAMLARGLDPNLRLSYDNTLLLHAALYGRRGCVRRLLEAGADPDATNELGEGADLLAADNPPDVAEAIITLLAQARARRGG